MKNISLLKGKVESFWICIVIINRVETVLGHSVYLDQMGHFSDSCGSPDKTKNQISPIFKWPLYVHAILKCNEDDSLLRNVS